MELPSELTKKGLAQFFVTSGTIITQSNYKTTQVWSENRVIPNFSGGGVVVQDVNSRDVSHADFWLLLENGKEMHVSLADMEAYALGGHRVSLIGAKTDDATYWVGFVNHNTGHYSWIAYDALLSPSVIVPMLWFLFVVWGIKFSPLSNRYSWAVAIGSAAVSSFLVTWPYRAIAKSVRRSSMKAHIKNIAEWLLENRGTESPEERHSVAVGIAANPALNQENKPEAVFCTECGTQLVVDDSFCSSCGMRMVVE